MRQIHEWAGYETLSDQVVAKANQQHHYEQPLTQPPATVVMVARKAVPGKDQR
jgi:hypothetical protein